ncbi:MAG: ATP-binding cassette domain-containing protein [Candidatus Dormibacteraeota bacterium]|nr:ATP-binding cassette domain-containing protein [Candidatus Dormibacteraeota bacterium]
MSVSVRRGEVVCVLGPNGSGKSTLLRSIIGELTPMAGQVVINDTNVTGSSADRLTRQGVGYVAQSDNVFEPLTVMENLDLGGYMLPRSIRASRVEQALALFPSLADKRARMARKLSGGERRMLAIARALVTDPTLVILDEPTANLTAELAERLLADYVKRLARDGAAVLLVEQRAREALRVADWAYVLADGHVQLAAPATELADRADLPLILLGQPADAEASATA